MSRAPLILNGLHFIDAPGPVQCDCCHDTAKGIAWICKSHPDESFALCEACDMDDCEPDGCCERDGINAPGYPDGVADFPYADNN